MKHRKNKSRIKNAKLSSHAPPPPHGSNTQPAKKFQKKEKPTEKPTKVQESINEVKNLRKDLLYLRAEFENYKRQAIKERSLLIKYGGQELAVALLEILDTFERALEMEINPETMASFEKGIRLTASELKTTLSRFGIQAIECTNQAFDPSIHEAIGSEETPHTTPGHITKVFKKPYKFHDKTIRTGQVIVAKQPKKVD